MEMTGKSANQLYKEEKKNGRTNLDFKTWIQIQKRRNFSNLTGAGAVPVNSALNSPIQDILTGIHEEGGLRTDAGTKYIFGINKTILIWSGIGIGALVAGIIVYKVIHRK